jgi:hypothetical protein
MGPFGSVTATKNACPMPPFVEGILGAGAAVNAVGFTPNAEVIFEIYASPGGALLVGPVTRPTDASGEHLFITGSIDLGPGHYIVVTDMTTESAKTLVVEDLHIDLVDTTTDSVIGRATPGKTINVFAGSEEMGGEEQQVVADGSGFWMADFAGVFDIMQEMKSEASIRDADCDVTIDVELASVGTTMEPGLDTSLTYTDTQGTTTSLQIPSGAVTETTQLFFTPSNLARLPTPSGSAYAQHAFELESYRDRQMLPNLSFERPVTVTIEYSDADLSGLDENSLSLKVWDESAGEWVNAANSCIPPSMPDRHLDENWLGVEICHQSRFALFGQYQVYLPLVSLIP